MHIGDNIKITINQEKNCILKDTYCLELHRNQSVWPCDSSKMRFGVSCSRETSGWREAGQAGAGVMPLGPFSPNQIPPIFENERRSVKKWIIHRAACKAGWTDSLMELSYFHHSSDHQVHKQMQTGIASVVATTWFERHLLRESCFGKERARDNFLTFRTMVLYPQYKLCIIVFYNCNFFYSWKNENLTLFIFKIYFFIWPCWVSVAAGGLFVVARGLLSAGAQ